MKIVKLAKVNKKAESISNKEAEREKDKLIQQMEEEKRKKKIKQKLNNHDQ